MKTPQWLEALGIPDSCISLASSAREGKCSFVIHTRPDEQVWRVKVDGCWIQSGAEKKVDYLFWGQSVSGQKLIILVELKGQHFGEALKQIENMLQRLCKRAAGSGIHTGPHRDSPGHNRASAGGVLAFTVLSTGKGVPKRLRERERIRQRYGVLVRSKTRRLEANGLDGLLSQS
jgi:hypothetical protein